MVFTHGKNCFTTHFFGILIVKGHTTLLHVESFTVELIMRLPSSALGLCLTWGATQSLNSCQGCRKFYSVLTCFKYPLYVWDMWNVHQIPQWLSPFQGLLLHFCLFFHSVSHHSQEGPQPLARRTAAFSWHSFSVICFKSNQSH